MTNITIPGLPVKTTEAIAADIFHIVSSGIDEQIPASLIAASISTLLSLGTVVTKDTGVLNGEVPLISTGGKLDNGLLNISAESLKGIAEIITQANADLDVNDTDILTILKLVTRGVSETKAGINLLPKQITISNGADTDHDIDFTAGNFVFDDGSGQAVATALTKQIDATFVEGDNQGGLDTGTVANNTFYHVFEIFNPTTITTDFLFSLSKTSPTFPSGYTKKNRLCTVRTNGSANIRTGQYTFDRSGNYRFEYDGYIEDRSNSDVPTSQTNLTLTAPPDTRAIITGRVDGDGTSSATWGIIRPSTNSNLVPSSTNFEYFLDIAGGGSTPTEKVFEKEVLCDSSSQVVIRSSQANKLTLQIFNQGWIDNVL